MYFSLPFTKMDETSENNDNGINLNQMVLKVTDLIEDAETLEAFRIKLDNIGYSIDPEYDLFNYLIKGSDSYRITDSFPRLRRCSLDSAIGNVKYTIIIAGIANYKE